MTETTQRELQSNILLSMPKQIILGTKKINLELVKRGYKEGKQFAGQFAPPPVLRGKPFSLA